MNERLTLFKNKLIEYNQNTQSLLFANPYSHSIVDRKGSLICCFCEDENHLEKYRDYISVYKEVLNDEVSRIKSFFEDENNDYESRLKFAFSIEGWEEHYPQNIGLSFTIIEGTSIVDNFKKKYEELSKKEDNLLRKEFKIRDNKYLCPTYLGSYGNEISDFVIDLNPRNRDEEVMLKKWLECSIYEVHNLYKESDSYKLDQLVNIPHTFRISKEIEFKFYNSIFSGLFRCSLLINDLGRKFKPSIFYSDYKEGFERGLNNLEEEYQIRLSDFYDVNKKEELINVLKFILYEKKFSLPLLGLLSQVDYLPFSWNRETIWKIGFYNGFLHSIYILQNKIGFNLEEEKQEIDDSKLNLKKEDINTNPYPHIFNNKRSFEFFEKLIEEFEIKISKRKLSLLTDIYILMRKDDLILESFKPTPFVNWINIQYDFNISKLKELTRTPIDSTKKLYSNSKQLFFTNRE